MRARPRPAFSLALAVSFPAAAAAQPVPDFDAAGQEAVETLQALIRLNTVSPPGNETRVAEFVRDLLAAEGIDSRIFASDPDRGNLVARLPGTGAEEPILIMGHSDVVGVERESWTVDPFSGEIRDGYVYGRGANDDKDMIAAGVQVLLMLRRAGITLDRDVILLVEAGEEGMTEFGIDFMVENHLDEFRAEFALNEGGGVRRASDGTVTRLEISTAEKVPWRQVRLVARGTAGHGSMPRVDNPVVRLAAAVARIGSHPMPARLNETTREYFRRLAESSPPELAVLYRNIEDPVLGPIVEEYFRHHDLLANSMLRTSISPNIIEGGFRYNVIPSEAEATLDVRALPDEDMDAFLRELARIVDDPLVEVVPPVSWRPSGPPSPLDTELFRALENAQREMYPDATTLPSMLTAATDAAQLRAAGIPTYGIGTGGDATHGNDERISVRAMYELVELIYRVVVEAGGGRPVGAR